MPYQESLLEINRNLGLLAPGVRKLVELALEDCHKEGLMVAVFEGWRSPERQAALYSVGNEEITRATPGLSFHQYGLAVDIAYYTTDWSWAGNFVRPKEIFMSYGFDAPPSFEGGHFQISKGFKIKEIKETVEKSTLQAAWMALGVV